MSQKTIRILISGRVQGVSYRAWTVGAANRHGVHGWVRNRTDGTVEAVFHGLEEKVDALINDCWKGPSAAKVSNIEIIPHSENPNEGFQWLPTLEV